MRSRERMGLSPPNLTLCKTGSGADCSLAPRPLPTPVPAPDSFRPRRLCRRAIAPSWIASPGGPRRLGRHAETGKDLAGHVGRGDGGEDAQASVALGALENID